MVKSIYLRDGRRLAYSEYGEPTWQPALYFHGWPTSRLDARLAHAAAQKSGIRLLAVDRPGFGLSEFKPGRQILDWPLDVTALADALGLARFAILAVSGGGPYAVACAVLIPQRLTSVAIVGGLPPLDGSGGLQEMKLLERAGFLLAKRMRWGLRTGFVPIAWLVKRYPEGLLKLIERTLCRADQAVLGQMETRRAICDTLAEAFRGGGKGPALELGLFTRGWGFELSRITIPVHFFHGEDDAIVPPTMVRRQARLVPQSRLTLYPGEGHYSLPINHAVQILEAIRLM